MELSSNADKEAKYNALPILTPFNIPDGCGFLNNEDWGGAYFGLSTVIVDLYITKALRNPAWLLTPKYNADYSALEEHDLPRGQYIDSTSVRVLESLSEASEERIQETAAKIRKNETVFPSPMGSLDVMMRAFQLLAIDYPNVMLFRGASFDSKRGYQGIDFAPGNLEMALHYAQRVVGRKREEPVIVMLPLKDCVESYLHQHASIGTEGDWDRNSIEVSFRGNWGEEEYPSSLRVFRIPQTTQEIDSIKQRFAGAAIVL